MYKKTVLMLTLGLVSFSAFASQGLTKEVVTEIKRKELSNKASIAPRGNQPKKFVNENGDYVTVTVSSGPETGIKGSLKDFGNHIANNKVEATLIAVVLGLAMHGAHCLYKILPR